MNDPVKYGYTMMIFKKDKRMTSGMRLVEKISYPGYSGSAMMEELKYMRVDYPSDKFYLDFEFGV